MTTGSTVRRLSISVRIDSVAMIWAFSLLIMAGCSEESGPACFPVHGRVFYDNQPLAEAMVVFHPLDAESPQVLRPLACTDQEGRFELTTLMPRDGAPAGDYAITVELRELKADGDEMVRDGPNLLPDRYRDPKTSGLQFSVVEGVNEMAPLELENR
jgi:hypothetical protein